MAYSAPHIFAHEEYPTAANMNILSDGLNAVYTALAGKKIVPAVKQRQWLSADSDTLYDGITDEYSYYTNIRLWRWLFYANEGTLTNIAGTETVSLPNTNPSGYNVFDLSNVSWLTVGMAYKVKKVDWCFEDWEP